MRRVGYDGSVPEFMPARGSEAVDPRSGRVVREAIDGPQNVNSDPLSWLLAHRRIEQYQHDAGARFMGDWEKSQLVNYGSMNGAGSGGGTMRPADVKTDAMARFGAAVRVLGGEKTIGYRVLELVVMKRTSLGKAEALLRLSQKVGMGVLLAALDLLAVHYGLA